jgi:chromosome segregation ATPase
MEPKPSSYVVELQCRIAIDADEIKDLRSELQAAREAYEAHDARLAVRDKHIDALKEQLQAAHDWIRQRIWSNHGCRGPELYGDDGELQCKHGDMRRMPMEQVFEIDSRHTLENYAAYMELREQLQAARNDLADALDLKNGVGPTVLTALATERDKLRIELQAAQAENLSQSVQVGALYAKLDAAQEQLQAAQAEYQDLMRQHAATLNAYGSCQEALEKLQGEKHASPPEEIPLQD